MRLIDADVLTKDLEYYFGDKKWSYTAKCLIKDMPTAYDIDKVVEQLERQKDICKERRIRSEGGAMKYHYEGKEIALFEAIEILKGGAV